MQQAKAQKQPWRIENSTWGNGCQQINSRPEADLTNQEYHFDQTFHITSTGIRGLKRYGRSGSHLYYPHWYRFRDSVFFAIAHETGVFKENRK